MIIKCISFTAWACPCYDLAQEFKQLGNPYKDDLFLVHKFGMVIIIIVVVAAVVIEW